MSDKFEKIQGIISDQLGIDKSTIKLESKLTEDLGADSLDTVELVMAFEDEFSIEIPEEEAEKIDTVKSIVDYLEKT